MKNNNCGICNSEKRYDEYHKMYRRCDVCNSKHALKYYYNNRDKVLEKKRNFYHNNKGYFDRYNKTRQTRISDLENQIHTLTQAMENLKSAITVS